MWGSQQMNIKIIIIIRNPRRKSPQPENSAETSRQNDLSPLDKSLHTMKVHRNKNKISMNHHVLLQPEAAPLSLSVFTERIKRE